MLHGEGGDDAPDIPLADSLFYASNAAADSPQNHEVASAEGVGLPAQAVYRRIPRVQAKCGMGRCSKRVVLAVDREKLSDAFSLAELQAFHLGAYPQPDPLLPPVLFVAW